MRLFRYTFRREDGAAQSGSVEAANIQAARATLTEMGISPTDLREADENIVMVAEGQELPAQTKAEEEEVVDWSTLPTLKKAGAERSTVSAQYHPFLETLRLYAGWLAAWYVLIFAFGSYQMLRERPLGIPYLEELFLSKTVLSLAFTAFLFLTLSSIHRRLRRGVLLGVVLTIVGAGVLFLFWGSV